MQSLPFVKIGFRWRRVEEAPLKTGMNPGYFGGLFGGLLVSLANNTYNVGADAYAELTQYLSPQLDETINKNEGILAQKGLEIMNPYIIDTFNEASNFYSNIYDGSKSKDYDDFTDSKELKTYYDDFTDSKELKTYNYDDFTDSKELKIGSIIYTFPNQKALDIFLVMLERKPIFVSNPQIYVPEMLKIVGKQNGIQEKQNGKALSTKDDIVDYEIIGNTMELYFAANDIKKTFFKKTTVKEKPTDIILNIAIYRSFEIYRETLSSNEKKIFDQKNFLEKVSDVAIDQNRTKPNAAFNKLIKNQTRKEQNETSGALIDKNKTKVFIDFINNNQTQNEISGAQIDENQKQKAYDESENLDENTKGIIYYLINSVYNNIISISALPAIFALLILYRGRRGDPIKGRSRSLRKIFNILRYGKYYRNDEEFVEELRKKYKDEFGPFDQYANLNLKELEKESDRLLSKYKK